MKLREIMTLDPITLKPDQSVQEAATLFLEHEVDGAPVVDEEERIMGLFTKSHLYRCISQGLDRGTPVSVLMRRDVIIGHPNDNVEGLLYPGVGRLPVVEGDRVVGMVTRTDLSRTFFNSFREVSVEFETIINSTHNMIVSVDTDGLINVFNASAEKNLRISVDEVRGRPILDVFPTSGLLETLKSRAVEAMQKIILNDQLYLSNRSPIIKDGKVIGAVAVLQDISDLENLSQELVTVKELNEELDAIIESSFDGLYIADGQGMTLRVNKAFEMITGVSAIEFLGRDVADIENEGIVSESVTALALKKQEPVTIIQQYTRTNKTTLSTGNPVLDKNGKIFRVVSNVRDITELNNLQDKLEQMQNLSQHYQNQLRTLRLQYANTEMVVNAPRMKELLGTAFRMAQVESTILIVGESGTGKELVAEIIHNNSPRSQGAFIKVNCGAIPDNLLESELFGYEGGAFTGARKEGKPGFFEVAAGGTIFLDEIGELPYNLQVKLLRFLQNKEITRIGGSGPFKVDVRVLAATNRNLLEMVKAKLFREDLYYRLNVVPLMMPPLRDRKEDIPGLVSHFLQIFNRKYQMTKRISPDVVAAFMRYDWPGNVRELENLIERMLVVTSGDLIDVHHLPSHLEPQDDWGPKVVVTGILPYREAIESLERQLIEKAYRHFRTTRQMAAELQVNASTIVRKAAKYGISQ
ncbi:MAG TPA: sigma 54-interacting transcriptional regulator [Syntrophomonadaceae bacterium]|nr:sigma 54-interacting transcriptional regulator [Syntrophomonadaceae bacterium]